MTPEMTPAFAAQAFEVAHHRATLAVRDWMEDVLGLPFTGLPRRAALESLLLAARGRRREQLLDIIALGPADARSDWLRIEAMEDNYCGVDRTESPGVSVRLEEVA